MYSRVTKVFGLWHKRDKLPRFSDYGTSQKFPNYPDQGNLQTSAFQTIQIKKSVAVFFLPWFTAVFHVTFNIYVKM